MRHPAGSTQAISGAGKTLPQVLLARAAANPDVLAQRSKRKGIWQKFSWSDILMAVREYAGGLMAKGVGRGDAVAVIGENESEHFIAELAIQSVGAVCVSLYPDMTADELRFVCEHSEIATVFAQDQEQVDKVLGLVADLPRIRAVIYWEDKGMWSYEHPLLSDIAKLRALGAEYLTARPGVFEASVDAGKATDPAVILYTSGTTSRPKGVVWSHAFLLDNAQRLGNGAGTKPGMEYLSYIPLAWALEQFLGMGMGILQPLVVNFPERPESILADLREIGVETVFFGPRQWESLASTVETQMFAAGAARRAIYKLGLDVGRRTNLARLEGKTPPVWTRFVKPFAEFAVLKPLRDKLGLVRTRSALCAGAAMAPDAFRLFHTMGVPLRNAYGNTEFGLISIHQGETFDLETSGSIIPVDPAYGEQIEWKLTPQGELLVKGGTGFHRYLNEPDKTEERRDGEWFRTGDYCTRAPSGDIVFMDRLDDLRTLAGGETYPPQYIETRLRFSSFIREVMTVGEGERDNVAALVEIDGDVVSQWADEHKIGFSTFSDLSQKPEVRALIAGEIEKVNRLLPQHSRVASFANFPKPLDPDEGELTRTRKLRRGFLAERYASLIEALYGPGDALDLEIPIRYQDGKKGLLKSKVNIERIDHGPGTTARMEKREHRQLPVEAS
ncbi:long-chain fatty acid--CoA ligase [Mesorhizobium microcysteis]|uniref:Long-chain fatty acid--CoA ligase n=1 Tax=Neoaquamicrobium microcysteis TaxID=2682781 RepID=A0A5D4GZQ6_9HYPH|nr:AMP-binding protein [Mesorhizobium microcysteis]TYR33532.1 long-chain fatty acid--CoA ligase [Mesorhizobium microcysteis]